jgi:hypothetical protein
MASRMLLVYGTAMLALAAGCRGDAPAGSDAGTADAHVPLDAGADAHAPGDDASTGCVEATTTGAWTLGHVDDVSAEYRARLDPFVETRPWDLYFESVHVFDPATGGPVELVGTFELGAGADENYGTCAHCVIAFYGTSRDRGYFARAGTLTTTHDPFDVALEVVMEDVELVEVTIDPTDRSSTPVPGGGCIRIARIEASQVFSPPGWTCPAEAFADGARCDCECGILDRDCTDPSLPIDRCDPGQLCRPIARGPIGPFFGDSVCANDCDRAAGTYCPGAEVCVDHAFGDLCSAESEELDRVAQLGMLCADGALHCAIDVMGVSNGYCDLFARADGRCRPRCSEDADCDVAGDEHCYVVGGDASSGTEVPFGYCAVRYPEGWTCTGAEYEDGAQCDCGCGAPDPDCWDLSLPVDGCAAGEVCTDGSCAAPS